MRFAYQAWLAPFAGFVLMIFVAIVTTAMTRDEGLGRVETILIGLTPLLAFLATVGYGYFKSVQCLQRRRATGHGVAGLICNTLMLLLVAGAVYAAFDALSRVRETARQVAATPEARVQALADAVQRALPILLDDATSIVNASVVQPDQLTLTHHIHGITPEEFHQADYLQQLQSVTQAGTATNPILMELAGTGATVRFLYRHEDGTRLGDFVITP